MTNVQVPHVSRETSDRLQHLHDLVIRWSTKINLVSRSSISSIWKRHISDSLQFWPLAPPAAVWVDLGSGGGFPALPIACLSAEESPKTNFVLIESDKRKSVFLRTAIRELSLNARVENARVEGVLPQDADVVSARALADLDMLLNYVDRHIKPTGTSLLAKGETWKDEVALAQTNWQFAYEVNKSKTNPGSVILGIKDVSRVSPRR
ncbi:MAG: 16S rRNA (guanine(527)-N(7))-methyltransferase RsmG [Pseudomonadota bacterium]